jgi:hypothetical protein
MNELIEQLEELARDLRAAGGGMVVGSLDWEAQGGKARGVELALGLVRNFEGGVRGVGQAPKSLTITLRPIYEDFPQSFTVPIVPGKQVLSSLPFELNVEVEIE